MQSYMDMLDDQLDLLYQRKGELEAGIRENNLRIDELEKMLEGIEEVKQEFLETGEIELDEDGTLKNKAAEKALQEYEKRTGKKIDRENYAEVVAALDAARPEIKEEIGERFHDNDNKQEELDHINEGIERIEEAQRNGIDSEQEAREVIENIPDATQDALISSGAVTDEARDIIVKERGYDEVELDTTSEFSSMFGGAASGISDTESPTEIDNDLNLDDFSPS